MRTAHSVVVLKELSKFVSIGLLEVEVEVKTLVASTAVAFIVLNREVTIRLYHAILRRQ